MLDPKFEGMVEDIFCRSFTWDELQADGSTKVISHVVDTVRLFVTNQCRLQEVELIPGGKDVPVNDENKHDFVDAVGQGQNLTRLVFLT